MILSKKTTDRIFKDFSRIKVLVIGDIMFDHYIWGHVNRISPEAPVPVVHVTKESQMPGGSANVVSNLYAMGVQTGILGIIGKDSRGTFIKKSFQKKNVNIDGLISAPQRSTIEKIRIIAHSQQVVRVDRETRIPLNQKEKKIIIQKIRSLAPQYDAVIIEDYGKGLCSQDIIDEIISIKQKKGTIIISYDPKKGHDLRLKNIDLGTPNFSEAESIIDKRDEKIPALSTEHIGKSLRKRWKAHSVLLTLGEKGIALFEKGKKTFHIPTIAQEVYDVSGAGDTVIAAATAALASNATPREAAIVSNIAAGIVVGKLGTQTASRKEILDVMKKFQ